MVFLGFSYGFPGMDDFAHDDSHNDSDSPQVNPWRLLAPLWPLVSAPGLPMGPEMWDNLDPWLVVSSHPSEQYESHMVYIWLVNG